MREIVLGLVSTVSEGACLCFVHDGSTHSLAARRLNVIIPRLWRHCEVLCLGTGWIWWCDLDRSCLRGRAKSRHRERQGCTWTPETVGNLVLACFPGSKAVFATHTAVVSRGKRRGKVQGSGIWDLGFGDQLGLTSLSVVTARLSRVLHACTSWRREGGGSSMRNAFCDPHLTAGWREFAREFPCPPS